MPWISCPQLTLCWKNSFNFWGNHKNNNNKKRVFCWLSKSSLCLSVLFEGGVWVSEFCSKFLFTFLDLFWAARAKPQLLVFSAVLHHWFFVIWGLQRIFSWFLASVHVARAAWIRLRVCVTKLTELSPSQNMREKKLKYWWKELPIFPESFSGALPRCFNAHAQSPGTVRAGMEKFFLVKPPPASSTVPQQLFFLSSCLLTKGTVYF